MSLDQQSPPPTGPQGYYGAPPPKQGTSGLAIAGLILAILVAPIGFILSLIAIFRTGNGRPKGRGLAIAGVIVSVLIIGGATTLVVVASNSTLADPGCSAGKAAVLGSAGNPTDASAMQATIDGLNAATAKAKHANVRDATKALADDYTQMQQAIKTGNMPAGLVDKVSADGKTFDSLCTVGG
jgi:hypothetical protein